MMKRALLPMVLGAAMCGSAASAAVTVTVTDATDPYTGPAPTYDFETPVAGLTGGGIVTGSQSGQYRQPEGSTGKYLSVGIPGTTPSTTGPAILDLSLLGLPGIASISMLWGSLDSYNTLQLLDAANQVLFSINGNDPLVASGATLGETSRLVNFALSSDLHGQVSKIKFTTNGQNAFEVDNIAIQAVPEPVTWLMMMLGMLGVGFAMRRTPDTNVRVRYV